ncbi:hypothetical protein CHS0354_021017 [Potamilus streckersoni]|uniref:Mab-21-like HhH/H2TH-like domain-containing protein n=1 Tax=Potamilus streckersoni TaxID=2493646 RepID=A0AAE0SRZ3_9BIVA|nr:hypothetical protein CHS0354_021017 [Potamilus streckersoni]
MANTDRLSVFISAILDTMGFNRHMTDFRISNTRQMDVIGALENDFVGNILLGGKSEGTSLEGQGDTDIVYVIRLRTVSDRQIDPPSPQHTVLYTEDREVHPGYTWLRVGLNDHLDDIITHAMILKVGPNSKQDLYLSSSVFIKFQQETMQHIFPLHIQCQPISGPSQPLIIGGKQLDSVYAFHHPDWPVQASKWINRCGTNGWPPQTIVTAIVQSGCHIVPKGFKESPSSNMEWCISFAIHEKSILQLFNMTQKHFYILLKIMAKDLKERFPNLQDVVTSYTMKTVALWQVELHHTRNWDRSHLLDRVMEALSFLKSCVENRNLPAYFIPENNLFDGNINPCTATCLSRLLNDFLSQGARCVLTFTPIQQQQIQKQNPGIFLSGLEMFNLMIQFCRKYLDFNLSKKHILHSLSLINLPHMTRHRLLTTGVSKIMKATLAYVNIAKIMNAGMPNKRKYEFCRPLLLIASNNSGTDRMAGKVKFAGVLHVLGKTNKAIETLYSIKLRPLFGTCRKCHNRNIISQKYSGIKKDSDDIDAAFARLGRDNYVQHCISLDVRYTKEEMGIVPDAIKYEFFHKPESDLIYDSRRSEVYVDPDMLRYYLLYNCHTEQGDEVKAQGAFINLIRIATREKFDQYMEYREVALNVLGLCYLEKEDYFRSYNCFCRAMSLRPRLLVQKWSTSTPWHLAVLASKLINR